MLLKLWFLLTLVLTALLLGTTFAHILEVAAKLQYDAATWTRVQQTLYPAFAWIGGPIEIGAIAASVVLAFMLRRNPVPFYLSGGAALYLAIAFFGIWIFVTNAANVEVAQWSPPQSIPADWGAWRHQWEASHAVRFVLHLIAFTALVGALLASTPGP